MIKNIWCVACLLFMIAGCTKNKPPAASNETKASNGAAARTIAVDRAVYSWPPESSAKVDLVAEDRRLAKNFYVILDGSGSMESTECSGGKNKAEAAKEALKVFAAAVPKDSNLGLLVFDNSGTSERVPLGINNRTHFESALKNMVVGGGTPLGSAINKGLDALQTQARSQLGYGEYNIVVVTDGAANKDDRPDTVVNLLASKTPVVIHTVGFCLGENHALNQPGVTLYKTAMNPSELLTGLEDVLAESESFDVAEFN